MSLPQNITNEIYHKLPNFWLRNGSGEFVQVIRADLNCLLAQRATTAGHKANKKEIRVAVAGIAENQAIDYVLPNLPGYPVGLHLLNQTKILVPQALRIIQPAKGSTPIIDQILLGQLGSAQLTYIYGWLQEGYHCLQNNECRPGQVLILAGPQGCGKNLVQEQIITPIFGGRIAEPYYFAVGKTNFNQDHYKAMHLMISDQKNPAERRDMQEYSRRMASNDFEWFHPKGKEAISLPVLWRLSISCNEQKKDLGIVPPLEGLENKVMLLRCELQQMPIPTATALQRKAFRATIAAELPAFVYKLLDFKIPKTLRDDRFGIKGYINPQLAKLVRELDPEEELLNLIRDYKEAVPGAQLDNVTANSIHDRLYHQDSLRPQLLSTAKSAHAVGYLLGKLADRNDGVVIKRSLNQGIQRWSIKL